MLTFPVNMLSPGLSVAPVTFKSAASQMFGSGGVSTDLTLPGGIVSGDLILVFCAGSLSSLDITGFTGGYSKEVDVQYNNDGNDNVVDLYAKKAAGGESSVQATWSTGGVNYRAMGALVYEGADTTSSPVPTVKQQPIFVSNNMVTNSWTDAPAGDMNVVVWWVNRSSTSDVNISATPAGMTQRILLDGVSGPTSRPDVILSVYELAGSGAGSIQKQQNYDQGDCAHVNYGIQLAV